MSEIPTDLMKDKNGLVYGVFKDISFTAFSAEKGNVSLKVTGIGLLAFRIVDSTERRTQDFTMLKYAGKIKRPNKFVETGTDEGQMIEMVKDIFKEIYSIEIDKERYDKAKERFKDSPQIHLINGNSGELIPRKADLYWLDAHTAPCTIGKKVSSYHTTGICPLIEELKRIKKFKYILIDDVSMMTGQCGFPSLSEIAVVVKNKWGIKCWIENEIIVIDKKNKY